ncbi:MAG: hypothetical protein HQM15_09440 [Deltaproteobacteria bacterium]|nr:hypothetical protein [Deltaproteobacteria bacterium]
MKNMGNRMKKSFLPILKHRSFCLLFIFVFLFAACGGADNPYIAGAPGTDTGAAGGSGSNPPPGGGGGGTSGGLGSGCTVKLKAGAKLGVHVKINPGEDPDADPSGILSFPPTDLPDLIFHFSGETAIIDSSEFPQITLSAFGQSATAKQKPGNRGSGTYNFDQGSINIENVILQVLSPIQVEFAPSKLTTEELQITGSKGNLTETGSRLDKTTKKVALVGGFAVPTDFVLPKYQGTAVTIKMDGEFDTVPDPAQCSGSIDGPVAFREVTPAATAGGPAVEVAIPSNTLNMSYVYVPEAGVDNPQPTDALYPKFHRTKTIRVKNNQATALSGTIANLPSGFNMSPSTYNIAPGGTQDFTVDFAFLPISNYATVAASSDVTAAIHFGPATLNLAGTAKRAAPEMSVDAAHAIAFGTIPIHVSDSGGVSHMQCFSSDGMTALTPSIVKKVFITNNGVRSLNVQNILPPADTDTDTQVDCGRGFGGQEFIRLNLADDVANGASCGHQNVAGHDYILEPCSINPGRGALSFFVAYIPKNANTVTGSPAFDTASMIINNNDPAFAATSTTPAGYKIDLNAAVSKDLSDLLTMQKQVPGAPVINNTQVKNNGSLSIDVGESQTDKTVVFELINESSEQLRISQITLTKQDGTDSTDLQLVPGTAPTQVPASAPDPGKAPLSIKFTKPAGAIAGSITPAFLKIKYAPASTITSAQPQGVTSAFTLNLSGTVGLAFQNGSYSIQVDVFNALLKKDTRAVTSLDYRIPNTRTNWGSGPLNVTVQDRVNHETDDPNHVIREIRLTETRSPDSFTIPSLREMSVDERKSLIRVFTSKNTTCRGGVSCDDNSETPACDEPTNADISAPYPAAGGKCSYFYYVMVPDPDPRLSAADRMGTYNTETGELVIPHVNIKSINPYHNGIIQPSEVADNLLKTTITTGIINTTSLIDPAIGSDYVIPAAVIAAHPADLPPCPAAWNPTIPLDGAHPELSPKSTLQCFMDRGPGGTGDAYMKGKTAVPFADGGTVKRSIAVVMVMKYTDETTVPSFLKGSVMWIGMQGILVGPH